MYSQTEKRVLELSYKYKLAHVGSNLTALPIIEWIYEEEKTPEDVFILSAGHGHVAHLVVQEKQGLLNAEEELEKHGIHCSRQAGCAVSTGSLGHGLPIAVGLAMADSSRTVYCLISDGECSEGSVWESFNIIKEQNVKNIKVFINWNGWSAYRKVLIPKEFADLKYVTVVKTNTDKYPFLKALDAHYHIITEQEYLTL